MSVELSKRQKAEQGEAMLRALLRSPKSRSGLIAAAHTKGLTKNFVFGYLSVATTSGEVAVLKSGDKDLYQLGSRFSVEAPTPSEYPPWLDPRALPPISRRRVFIGAKPAEIQEEGATP